MYDTKLSITELVGGVKTEGHCTVTISFVLSGQASFFYDQVAIMTNSFHHIKSQGFFMFINELFFLK